MPFSTTILAKLALSGGVSVLSKLLESSQGDSTTDKALNALNSVTGGVATSFLHQYSNQIDYKDLGRFLTENDESDYESVNHDLEKLMIKSVGEAYRYLRETYSARYETHKGEIAFLKELENQAKVRPNDQTDYKLIAQNKKKWLDKNQYYAWHFASEFIERSQYDTEDLHIDFIKEFIETHFEKAFEVAFNEGLKDPKDEKPYKAFIIKTLNGLGAQIKDGNKEILNRLSELERNHQKYLDKGRTYLNQEWITRDDEFKKESLKFLRKLRVGQEKTHENQERQINLLNKVLEIIDSSTTTEIVVLVFASVKKEIIDLGYLSEMEELFGESVEDWKPFCGESNIMNILEEFEDSSRFKLKVVIARDIKFETHQDHVDFADRISSKVLFVVDGISILRNEYEQIRNTINHNVNIGGLLFPFCEKISNKEHRRMVLENFEKKMWMSTERFFNKLSIAYHNVELVIPSKQLFFRRLTNIASHSLGAKPEVEQVALERFNRVKEFPGSGM